MDHCQSAAVVAVCVGTKLVLDHMSLEVSHLTKLQNTVLCHCGIPHEFSSCVLIKYIFGHDFEIPDDVSHDSFIDLIRNIRGAWAAEIRFHAVT